MKKIALILAVIMLAGCKQMDRKNPTDPLAANYIGWTYIGEIGAFAHLTDFIIAVDPSDGKDYIYAVDGSAEEIQEFFVDGTPVGTIPNPAIPVFFNPSGICELNGYCYIIDTVSIDAFRIVNLNDAWTDSLVKGDKILSYSNTLYVVTADPPGIATYLSDVNTPNAYTPLSMWTIVKGDTTCANCMSYISDIAVAVNPLTSEIEIMLVDSVKKRVSIFNTAGTGTLLRQLDIGSDISSVAILGDVLYVPTIDGIRRYTYSTGAPLETIANYGEGNGRITKPGPIEVYDNPVDGKHYVYVGAGKLIKVFDIGSF